MAYKSEADQWRDKFESQKAETIRLGIINADLYQWNSKLAEETIRIRDTNRLLRHENANLRASFFIIAYWVAGVTIWNIFT